MVRPSGHTRYASPLVLAGVRRSIEAMRWPSATSDWVMAIRDLTRRVETGRVYDRDLESLADAVNDLVGAMARRGQRH